MTTGEHITGFFYAQKIKTHPQNKKLKTKIQTFAQIVSKKIVGLCNP